MEASISRGVSREGGGQGWYDPQVSPNKRKSSQGYSLLLKQPLLSFFVAHNVWKDSGWSSGIKSTDLGNKTRTN